MSLHRNRRFFRKNSRWEFDRRAANRNRFQRARLELLEDRRMLAFTVNSAGDETDFDLTDGIADIGRFDPDLGEIVPAGITTLRAAIQQANADGGGTINFSVAQIAPQQALPDITAPVVVDGGSRGAVQINGSDLRFIDDGIVLAAGSDGSTIQGMFITQFGGDAIVVLSAGNTIAQNVLSGNEDDGMTLFGAGATGNVVTGNYVGLDPSGVSGLPNIFDGIRISNASGNTIGGPGDLANVISGNNEGAGVLITGASTGNVVTGNLIGVSATGAVAVPNDKGVEIDGAVGNTIGGATRAAGNVISGNAFGGIILREGANENTVANNQVGVDASGNSPIGNADDGIWVLESSRNVIGPGNTISANVGDGIAITGDPASTNNNRIFGNIIGLNSAGTAALGNTDDGIYLNDTTGNTIGGTGDEGNVISANGGRGVWVVGDSSGNTIEGNIVGLDISMTQAQGNDSDGINLFGAAVSNNTIVANVVSGNRSSGVTISGGASNSVSDNIIGLDGGNTFALPNDGNGVGVSGGANNIIANNAIAGNDSDGVRIHPDTSGTMVTGNTIGLNAAGEAVPNDTGVSIAWASDNIIGGAGAAGNVISGNRFDGVSISGSVDRQAANNQIVGNIIGLRADGVTPVGNGGGIDIFNAASNTIGGIGGLGNIVAGNNGVGISISASEGFDSPDNVVLGNFVGVAQDGVTPVGNSRTGIWVRRSTGARIGGIGAGEGNVISDNDSIGIWIESGAHGAIVQGNIVGADVSGTVPLGNGSVGITVDESAGVVIGGTAALGGNQVVDSTLYGISARGAATTNLFIQGNIIGTDESGLLDLGNGADGVSIADGVVGATIGGESGTVGNTIANNERAGVSVAGGAANRIHRNSIYNNVGLGIDLGAFGVNENDNADPEQVTPPDIDSGPNNLQNYPVLGLAVGGSDVVGTLRSTPNTSFTIEIFSSPVGDESGFGEGKTYLTTIVTSTNASGVATFAVPNADGILTATATDPDGNTSEFSNALDPAVVGIDLAPLKLEGDFEEVEPGKFRAVNGAAIGLKPAQGEEFRPLVEVDGSVEYDRDKVVATGDFKALKLDADKFLFSGSMTINVGDASTSILVDNGADGGNPVLIAGFDLALAKLGFANPSGGSTSDSQLELEGRIELLHDDFRLAGLANSPIGFPLT
ncbi:MAG: right-handed parallel beta-helix repeat-containing protein, partial [Planctomycetales bacterium]|nr:right-handed parallel beta-helix repeat-containing protein [Planctomycetales bacterium]